MAPHLQRARSRETARCPASKRANLSVFVYEQPTFYDTSDVEHVQRCRASVTSYDHRHNVITSSANLETTLPLAPFSEPDAEGVTLSIKRMRKGGQKGTRKRLVGGVWSHRKELATRPNVEKDAGHATIVPAQDPQVSNCACICCKTDCKQPSVCGPAPNRCASCGHWRRVYCVVISQKTPPPSPLDMDEARAVNHCNQMSDITDLLDQHNVVATPSDIDEADEISDGPDTESSDATHPFCHLDRAEYPPILSPDIQCEFEYMSSIRARDVAAKRNTSEPSGAASKTCAFPRLGIQESPSAAPGKRKRVCLYKLHCVESKTTWRTGCGRKYYCIA
jgi:hypothetical protein